MKRQSGIAFFLFFMGLGAAAFPANYIQVKCEPGIKILLSGEYSGISSADLGGYIVCDALGENCWKDIATEPDNGRMDNVVAGYDGLIWSITGFGSNTNVRTYDPVAEAWSNVDGANPPFGTNHARSGALWGYKVYMYGDATTSGFNGLWSFNMITHAWVNETPSGRPPPSTGIWAPAWVTDPATGLLYMTGGATTPGGGNLTTVYVYDPVTNAWQNPLPHFTTARNFHAAFVFFRSSDGHKLLCIVGGVTSDNVTLKSTQCYDFTTGSWGTENADVPPLGFDLWGMGYAQWYGTDPILWVTGGVTDGSNTLTNYAYFYDAATGAWMDGGPFTGAAVFRTSATLAVDGGIFKVGGSTGGFSYTGQAARNRPMPCDYFYTGCSAGDLDKSGNCDSADCVLLCSYLSGCIVTLSCDISYSDLDWNTYVNVIDLTILLNHLAGNIPVIPLP